MPTAISPDNAGLRALQALFHFGDSELEALMAGSRALRFSPQERLIGKDDQTQDVFVILSGRVRVVDYSFTGREIAFDDLGPGTLVGELAALDGGSRSANVVALEATEVLSVSARCFIEVFSSNPASATALFAHLAKRIRQATERIMDLSTLAAYNRVQAEILRLARQSDHQGGGEGAIIHPIPIHADMASRVSTTRETVARVFSELTKEGLIIRERDRLVVTDLAELEQMVQEFRGG